MSYVEQTRGAVHAWLAKQPPETMAEVLDAGRQIMYGDHRLASSYEIDVPWRDLQTWGPGADVLVVDYLAALVVPEDPGESGWIGVEVGEPPCSDGQLDENRDLLVDLPSQFRAEIDCVPGAVSDGVLSRSEPIGRKRSDDLWASRSVPLAIGYCQPKTLVHHIRLCSSFVCWPYYSSSIYIYRMSQKRWRTGYGRARAEYLPSVEETKRRSGVVDGDRL